MVVTKFETAEQDLFSESISKEPMDWGVFAVAVEKWFDNHLRTNPILQEIQTIAKKIIPKKIDVEAWRTARINEVSPTNPDKVYDFLGKLTLVHILHDTQDPNEIESLKPRGSSFETRSSKAMRSLLQLITLELVELGDEKIEPLLERAYDNALDKLATLVYSSSTKLVSFNLPYAARHGHHFSCFVIKKNQITKEGVHISSYQLDVELPHLG